MALMVIAAYAGFQMEKVHAQEPAPAQEQVAPEGEAASESAEQAKEPEAAKPAEEPAPAASGNTISFYALFMAGGWSMWPLLLSSIVGMIFIFERIIYYTMTKVSSKTYQQDLLDAISQKGLAGVKDLLASTENLLISKILKEGLEISRNDADNFARGVEKEAAGVLVRAERGISVLAAVSTIAPLIGFLGTVSGMIGAFDAIANADSVNAKVVAGGIKEALITTATGLIIGIPAMAFFQYFTGVVNGYATEIEQAANNVYKELVRMASAKLSSTTSGES